MNPIYQTVVEYCMGQIEPLYFLLRDHSSESGHTLAEEWEAWWEEHERTPRALRSYIERPGTPEHHRFWGMALFLAPHIEWLSEWWPGVTGCYLFSEEIPDPAHLPGNVLALMRRLITINLEQVQVKSPWRETYYQILQDVSRLPKEGSRVQVAGGLPVIPAPVMLKHRIKTLLGRN